jgi:hypothetical protein
VVVVHAPVVSAIGGIIAAVVYFLGSRTNNLYRPARDRPSRTHGAHEVVALEVSVGGSPTQGLLLPPRLIGEKYF